MICKHNLEFIFKLPVFVVKASLRRVFIFVSICFQQGFGGDVWV